MTLDWLPGVLQLPADKDGGHQDLSYPPRVVLHTTENDVGSATVQDLAAFYRHSTYWPHFTADLARKQLAQHLPFSLGGRALSHSTSTQTNDAHCIQVEIIGRASSSPSWQPAQVDWLGHALGPVMVAVGIARRAPAFVAGGAGLNAPQRMSEATWRSFNGVCGHQHVPENDHYDPGAFDIARFLAATGATGPTPIPEDELTPTDYREIARYTADELVTKRTNADGTVTYGGVLTEMVKAELAGILKASKP